jgi:2-polyprenyl-6-methoxyphenol hydroxylase-like FAD-dependent oxidoreductase
MSNLDGVHPDFAEAFRATQVDGILHPPIRMRDMTPVELPRGKITLLGDAIHPMVPFRGEGGNMAMKDGITLASCIASEDDTSIEDMLKKYDAEMIPRTRKSVLASRAAGDPTQQG